MAHYLRTGAASAGTAAGRQKSILLGHYHAMLSQFGTGPGVRLARKHLSWYSRGLPGSAEFRATMNRLPDAGQVLALIDRFYDPLIARGVARSQRPRRASRDELLTAGSRPHERGRAPSAVASAGPRPLGGRHAAADAAAILGALPVPVVLLDAENRFRHVNHAAEQFLGISAAGLAQLRLDDLLPPDNPLFLLIEQVRRTEATIADHDLNLESPRLHKRGITVQGSPLPEEPGAVLLVMQDASAGTRAGPPARVPRRRPQRHRHGGDPGA